jgi:hypothetical protein
MLKDYGVPQLSFGSLFRGNVPLGVGTVNCESLD